MRIQDPLALLQTMVSCWHPYAKFIAKCLCSASYSHNPDLPLYLMQ